MPVGLCGVVVVRCSRCNALRIERFFALCRVLPISTCGPSGPPTCNHIVIYHRHAEIYTHLVGGRQSGRRMHCLSRWVGALAVLAMASGHHGSGESECARVRRASAETEQKRQGARRRVTVEHGREQVVVWWKTPAQHYCGRPSRRRTRTSTLPAASVSRECVRWVPEGVCVPGLPNTCCCRRQQRIES